MKKIYWIVGTSCVGKQTFITRLLRGRAKKIISSLGWEDKKISASQISITNIGQFKGDPSTSKRDAILDEITKLTDSEIILIKWQFVDSENNRPGKLRALLPEYEHEIIYIKSDKELNIKRLPLKSWWIDYGNEKPFCESELVAIKKCLQQFNIDGFKTAYTFESKQDGFELVK